MEAMLEAWSLKRFYLSAMDIFQDLSPEEMAEVERMAMMTSCLRGQLVYAPEEGGRLFLLKRGRIQVYQLSPEGRKLTLATLEAGTFFGELVLAGQSRHHAFAEAVEDCLLCVMERPDLERILLRYPKVALRVLEALGKRLQEAEQALEEVAFKSVPSRLASLLLRLGKDGEVRGLTHQDLAEMAATSRETATHVLDRFQAQGLVSLERKSIRLLDQKGLESLSGGK